MIILTPVVLEEIFIRDSSDDNDNYDDDNVDDDDELNNSFIYDTPSLENGLTYNVSLAAVNHLGVPGKLVRRRDTEVMHYGHRDRTRARTLCCFGLFFSSFEHGKNLIVAPQLSSGW